MVLHAKKVEDTSDSEMNIILENSEGPIVGSNAARSNCSEVNN